MAPEVLSLLGQRSTYSCKSDCWSLGVLLYILLCGREPFMKGSLDLESLRKEVVEGRYAPMVGSRWEEVSKEGKLLVAELLQVDPDNRLAAVEVLEHQWFQGDPVVVAQAKALMGNLGEDRDSGRGSSGEVVGVRSGEGVEAGEVRRGRPRGERKRMRVLTEGMK